MTQTLTRATFLNSLWPSPFNLHPSPFHPPYFTFRHATCFLFSSSSLIHLSLSALFLSPYILHSLPFVFYPVGKIPNDVPIITASFGHFPNDAPETAATFGRTQIDRNKEYSFRALQKELMCSAPRISTG